MNFDFSDEQKQLRDQARRFLEERSPPRLLRDLLDGKGRDDRSLWNGVAELGWAGTAIPEEYGGVGLGHVDLCVIAEEIGRAAAPIPFSSSVYLATEALLLAGSEAQKRKWLPKLAAGEAIGTFALSEGTKGASATNLTTRLENGTLSGTKLPVLDANLADFAIVVARSGRSDVALAIVELSASGITNEPLETVDGTRPHHKLVFDKTPAEALEAGEGWATVERLLDRAAVLIAFEQVGGAQRALEMARDYAIQRHAFGRPIGSYQGIKHKLADVYIATEIARSNAYYGAWALANDAPDLPVAAATARVGACEAFWLASKENIQTHGGMGFTWELDCHLFYRRATVLAQQIGGERSWKEKLISRLETRNA